MRRTPGSESTTVNVGDRQPTDSDQRQLVADPGSGDWGHAPDSNRGADSARIGGRQRVAYQATTTRTSNAISAMVTRERGI